MTDSISFGKKVNAGKIDLTKVKDGLTKAEIAGNDKKLQSIFDKVDTNRNEVLEKNELEEFHKELTRLAGDDSELTDKEAKGFRDADGKKMRRRHRKAFYEFLNKLSQNQQEPVQEQTAAQEQQQVVNKTQNKIQENVEETVLAQVANEIVDNDDKTEETVEPPVVEEKAEPEVTSGIIVQNGESPAAIAKKFGVSVEDLLAANESQVKGKGNKKYFLVGAEIVIPRKIEAEELAQLTAGRQTAEETSAQYAHDAQIRAERRAAAAEREKAEREALGIVNRNGAGTVVNTKTQAKKDGTFKNFSKNKPAFQKMTYTVVGETGNRGRMIVKASNGKYYTMAKDGIILNESYVQKTNFYDRKDTKKVTINGKQYAVAGSRGDKHGRSVAIDANGNQVVLSADNKKVLRNDYVSASDARDAGAAKATLTGGKNVTYVKDANGRVWYFDEKTGKALVKGDHTAMVQKEADKVAQNLLDGANHTWGTDEEKIAEGVNNIYSPEIMARVNKTLKSKDNDYAGDAMTTPVEALLINELSRSEVRGHITTMANNGAYGTGAARDAAMGRNAAREIQYEVHGGITGWTSTKDLKEAMSLADTRDARLVTEGIIKNNVKGSPNEGSYVRQYIAEDDLGIDWSAQEVDQFDATWVKNGAYDHEHDQAHRNAVTGRLVFEYGNEESLHTGLEAIDPESADYQYISKRAVEENKKQGYQAHFNGQEALQTYIAGRATDENGKVETPEVSACNTLLYKGEKPIRIQAEEALYDAKTGDFSNMFNSMDPKVYEEMADMIAEGEVEGCKDITEAFDKALNSVTNSNDKTKIKANAIISGQIEFSDEEVTDFCIELMHRIDNNRGLGASSHHSASATNTADYQTVQLIAILQARPEVIASVKEKVQAGDFSYSVTIDNGPDAMSTILDHNTKADYLSIIADSKHVANEAIFYDKDGNQITNPEEIAALTNANMQALQGMREYVAQLERDFKKGVDAEGGLSSMANGILTYSGLGTDREDVATRYRNAKIMLYQLEAAAQGKLRDSDGKVISVQDLAQNITETQNKLAATNGDYQSSMQMARMGIVLAPVIAVTTVATMGSSTLLASGFGAGLGLATATGTGTFALTSAGVVTTNIIAGVATGVTTYGLNAYEYNTSLTGNTAEAREQNAIDSTIAGVSTFIGAQQMGPVSKLFNNANAFIRGGGRLTTVLASDVGVGAAGEYVQTGTVTVNGVAMNAIFSATGNFIGIKSLAKKAEIPANTPHVEINNHPSHDAEAVNRALHQEHIEADHHAGYVRKRQQEADKLAVDMDPEQNVVTPEQQAAYDREIAYQPVPEADRPAFDAHQKQVAADYADAHKIENNAVIIETSAPKAPKGDIEKLADEIKGLDGNIRRVKQQMEGAKRFGKDTSKYEQQLKTLETKRAGKQAALDKLQNPVAEPEVVVKADESPAEPVVNADDAEPAVKPQDSEPVARADEAEPVVKADDAQPAVKPEEAPTPENIARDAQAIPDAEIPVEHRSLWKNCQEKINKILSGAGKLAIGEVKTVLSTLKTLYNAVKNVKVRTQIARLAKKIQAYAKSKLQPKTPAVEANAKIQNDIPVVEVNESNVINNSNLESVDDAIVVEVATPHDKLIFDIQGQCKCNETLAEQLAAKMETNPEMLPHLEKLLKSGRPYNEIDEIINIATPDNIETLISLSKNKKLGLVYKTDGSLSRNDFAIILKIAEVNPANKAQLLDIAANSQRGQIDIYLISELMRKYPDNVAEITRLTKSNPNIKVGYDLNNNLSHNIDDIIAQMNNKPQLRDEILDFMSVQRKALNDTTDPVEDLGTYINLLENQPKNRKIITTLAKDHNLDVSDIDQLLRRYQNNPEALADIQGLADKQFTLEMIENKLKRIRKFPELRKIMLSDAPSYNLIDNAVNNTPSEVIQQRFAIRDNIEKFAADDLATLRTTLGDEFYPKVKWEEIIPANASKKEVQAILADINENSKFFARTAGNERKYGKNIKWASEMGNISRSAQVQIKNGENFDDVISSIANDYRAYDEVSTFNSNMGTDDRRQYSGLFRGDMGVQDGHIGATTGIGDYPTYRNRFYQMENQIRTYQGIELTTFGAYPERGTGLYMLHPTNQNVKPAMNLIKKNYDNLQPLVKKVQNGGSLTPSEINFVHEQIAESYYLLGNVMPWARGSNGISDLYMRSLYQSLNIEQPALKHGVSLDLEAFTMSMDEYKAKWNTFFENGTGIANDFDVEIIGYTEAPTTNRKTQQTYAEPYAESYAPAQQTYQDFQTIDDLNNNLAVGAMFDDGFTPAPDIFEPDNQYWLDDIIM